MTAVELEKMVYQNAVLGAVLTSNDYDSQRESVLKELKALAITAGAKIVGEVIQIRNRPHPAYFFGKGKVKEISELISEENADLFIFDDDLTPAQVRNLEDAFEVPVIDRSTLILDIFALHAKTVEARAQVKLAQLKHLLPSLTGRWSHLERQEGAIGTRGPGETQLETDKRIVQKQIADLQSRLREIEREREVQRKKRSKFYRVVLVGYTNAGKSTILNKLTGADVLVEDKLFATLDSTTRRLNLGPCQTALITDTVGFISKLPTHLVASFRSTLTDVRDADLLLHIIDASSPKMENKIAIVNKELNRFSPLTPNRVLVFNKIDLMEDSFRLEMLKKRHNNSLFISAIESNYIDKVEKRILSEYNKSQKKAVFILKQKDSEAYSKIAGSCRIIDIKTDGDKMIVHFSGSSEVIGNLKKNYSQLDQSEAI